MEMRPCGGRRGSKDRISEPKESVGGRGHRGTRVRKALEKPDPVKKKIGTGSLESLMEDLLKAGGISATRGRLVYKL